MRGNILSADLLNHRIRAVAVKTGLISTIAGTGVAGFNGDDIAATSAMLNSPSGIVEDSAGNIFISDLYNNRVRKITLITGLISTIAGTGSPGFNSDNIAAVHALLFSPMGLAIDHFGNVYIADQDNNRVRKVTMSTGEISTVAGTGVAGFNGDDIDAMDAQLHYPVGVCVDWEENMYIVDQSNNRIRYVAATTGIITTLIGTGDSGFNGDSRDLTTTELNMPFGIAIGASGDIYFSDSGNHRVRRISFHSINAEDTLNGEWATALY